MNFLIIPLDKLKEWDPQWEYRRRSNDGTKAILHEEIYNEIFISKEENPKESVEPPKPRKMARTMSARTMSAEPPIVEERKYPYPLVSGEELDTMKDFMSEQPEEVTPANPPTEPEKGTEEPVKTPPKENKKPEKESKDPFSVF